MNERTVLASFLCEEDARRAEAEIRALGVHVTQVDDLAGVPGRPPDRDSFLISGDFPGLASITLGRTGQGPDAAALLAAHPAASGMADGADIITGRNVLLTVVCPEALTEQVVRVIRACGGST
ncbi:hypothetical protein GCM10010885_01000 [Alicyclobacillus cellulosilyticus]|uniref:Uncharacterized protein n=1 Tax=Alicyclobacillus cellulosilyticus TaxID=1003997 RepID=A0A917JZU8_9BACL|nr:hypothetical protein [Alicyclobacillus cellulosilyticus]GGI95198.1 hypothetical protein GCM10010885_01000 [Alicyclobacillus cellulosilyticus]